VRNSIDHLSLHRRSTDSSGVIPDADDVKFSMLQKACHSLGDDPEYSQLVRPDSRESPQKNLAIGASNSVDFVGVISANSFPAHVLGSGLLSLQAINRIGIDGLEAQSRTSRQDFPDTEIAGVFSSDDKNTTKSTSMFAECIYDHLDDAQLAELLSRLEMGVQR
jgi:hypothetical protein